MFSIHLILERWKFNKDYQVWVSTEGKIFDKKKKPIELTAYDGYIYFENCGKIGKVHKLVLETFKKKQEGMTIDHINHNTRDNRLSNLRYLSPEENSRVSELHKKLDMIDHPRKKSNQSNHYSEPRTLVLRRIEDGSVIMKGTRRGIKKAIKEMYGLTTDSEIKALGENLSRVKKNKPPIKKYGFLIECVE